ncbi:hypothetical protein [Chryseobacterium indologenes]|uniref:hypothetical protein n=1 Tax=Chryseobacterium indologenes TaxID=253 RepID=UPI000B51BA41|nr:hypothetical protein [Chryseobacterium indologenes]ASE63747.1 hypothetical protein CEQ15_20790 [Chryseobacterium indologenes]VFA43383.1 Uncharacterised protein [Chryseobacterium indologenes]
MKRIFRYFWVIACFTLFITCNHDNDDAKPEAENEKTEQSGKLITRYFVPGQYNEYWKYDNDQKLVEIKNGKVTTTFTYDEKNRVVSAKRFTDTIHVSQTYQFEYAPGEVVMTYKSGLKVKYTLNSEGQPIKKFTKVGDRDFVFDSEYVYQNGNIVKIISQFWDTTEFSYDNNKNVLSDYPLGVKLIGFDRYMNGLGYVSKNNIVSRTVYANGNFIFDESYNLTYNKNGYLTKIQNMFEYHTFTY